MPPIRLCWKRKNVVSHHGKIIFIEMSISVVVDGVLFDVGQPARPGTHQ